MTEILSQTEIDGLLTAISTSSEDDAQHFIVNVIRRLEDQGDIALRSH